MKKYPFEKSYVLHINDVHQKRAIDISITKCLGRMTDASSAEKLEIMECLDVLQKKKEMIDDFRAHNPHLYERKK